MRGCFVTGTDTGVGKTVLTGAIVARLRQLGYPVRARKPLITGLDDPPDPDWPPDHVVLAQASGEAPEATMLVGYGPAVSPHLAAELAGGPIELMPLVQALRNTHEAGSVLVVEGVGGLLVPISDHASVRDLARELALPVVIAARPGLGTINHCLLTLLAARADGLQVAGIVFTPWPEEPDMIERSNLETVARLGGVEVVTLPHIPSSQPPDLAAAGSALPLGRWLE
jgi:dethiobiotin synthetase